MNDEIDDDCVCDHGGTCSAAQAAACYRKTMLRLDGPRELARQAAKLEEEQLEGLRTEARRLVALVTSDPRFEPHRRQLQTLLSAWPTERTNVDSAPPIARSTPAVGRGSRFYLPSGECVEWH